MRLDKSNNLYAKAHAFAIRIVRFYQWTIEKKREFVLSKQLLRCGTSIGANVAEANGGISTQDFSSKISTAYKESLETKYWLSVMKETNLIEPKLYDSLHKDADELSKILFSILKSTRIKSR